MIHYSTVINDPSQKRDILTLMIMVDTLSPNYTFTILCDEETLEYIKGFPYTFLGNIDFIPDTSESTKMIDVFIKRVTVMRKCINKWGSTLHVPPHLYAIQEFQLPDNISNVSFIENQCETLHEYQKYSLDLLYIVSSECVDFIEKVANDAASNIKDDDENNETQLNTQLNTQQSAYSNTWRDLPIKLKEEFSINVFLPYNYCIATSSFFAYGKSLKRENIQIEKDNKSLMYCNDYSFCKSSKGINNKVLHSEPIYFVNVTPNVRTEQLIKLNNDILNIILRSNVKKYLSVIKLRSCSNGSFDIDIPNKDGVCHWDRRLDPPGLYDYIDIIADHYLSRFEYFLVLTTYHMQKKMKSLYNNYMVKIR